MTRTFDYLFTLRKPKNYVNGTVKIYLRITIDGQRCETATAQFADPELWDIKAGRVKGKSEEARSINSLIFCRLNYMNRMLSYCRPIFLSLQCY